MTSHLETTEVNGVPGFTANCETTQGGEQLTCRFTILLEGKRQYTLNEQAVSSDWASMESTLHQVVLSFKTFSNVRVATLTGAAADRPDSREVRQGLP